MVCNLSRARTLYRTAKPVDKKKKKKKEYRIKQKKKKENFAALSLVKPFRPTLT